MRLSQKSEISVILPAPMNIGGACRRTADVDNQKVVWFVKLTITTF